MHKAGRHRGTPPRWPAAEGRKAAVLPAGWGAELRVVWRDNDFPYHFAPGIEHHNVWSTRPLEPEELELVGALLDAWQAGGGGLACMRHAPAHAWGQEADAGGSASGALALGVWSEAAGRAAGKGRW